MINKWILKILICQLYLRVALAELKLVQAVFRHGHRMPTKEKYYPNDPYAKYTYEPEGPGGLTNVGKMSSYKLGQYFRERYDQFLGQIYRKDDIYFRADEVDRIVMTGQLVASGLYPPNGEQKWNTHLNWQPIPVWAPPMATDYLYNGLFCENYQIWRNDVERTDESVIKFEIENRDIYRYLSQHTGTNITQSRTLGLRQILYAQSDIGLKLPEWTKSVFPNRKLDELAARDIIIRGRSMKLRRLLGGVWIREWLKHVDNHLNKTDTRKAFMYAAHELNIGAILVALNNYDNQIPSYSSTLLFELHEEYNKYYVKVLYKNNNDIRILKFPNCNNTCPIDVFKKYVEPVIPIDPETMCKKADIESLYQ